MTSPFVRRSAALLALVALGAGCSPDATAPRSEAPPFLGGIIGGAGRAVDDLLTCHVAETQSATETVGPAGGTIVVGRHALAIPPGALAEPVTITATAPAGERVELRFEPHGLRFERRVGLRMSYADCGVVRALLLRIAYVDPATETILEVLPSFPDLLREQVYGTTDHFSSYMLAY